MIDTGYIKSILEKVPDPEIPVISVLDLGVIRNIEIISDEEVIISITPTYSGCPAMKTIEDDVRIALRNAGIKTVKIETVYSPAWTTDWMSEETREKLREYGIAPPEGKAEDAATFFSRSKKITCPRCGSQNTEVKSDFGSTACKALYICKDCLEPFDYFKCI